MAVRTSPLLAAALIAVALVGPVRADEICEACWEVGGRGAWLSTSDEVGADSSVGLGATARFHFRPYWSVEMALDHHPGSIPDGPDESFTFLIISGSFTFRAERDQRTRPYVFLGGGLVYDSVSSNRVQVDTPSRSLPASAPSSNDTGFVYGLGGGGLTSLSSRTWLRYEVRWLQWSTFGIDQDALQFGVGVTWRLGRF